MTAIRAVGLLSGGLDSALAARLLIDQGVEVVGLHLESPTACRSEVTETARELGIRLVVRAKGEEYLRLLRHPRFGYGKNMNPCVDCRLFMFRLAQPYLEEFDARFLFSGEVLGQRPMSQTREAIARIDRESGIAGWIVRPLSARLLPQTEPERLGWLDRSRLLDVYGRGRQRQLDLAAGFGLRVFQSPGGGCLLTDPFFSRKVRDLFENDPAEGATMQDLALLRIGRHFRFGESLKIVLGRSEDENHRLAEFAGDGRWRVEPVDFSGPTALVCGPDDDAALARALELIVRYTRAPEPHFVVRIRRGAGEETRSLEDLARAANPLLPQSL
jgi:tRNA-uridine 2-sulfurtransferase